MFGSGNAFSGGGGFGQNKSSGFGSFGQSSNTAGNTGGGFGAPSNTGGFGASNTGAFGGGNTGGAFGSANTGGGFGGAGNTGGGFGASNTGAGFGQSAPSSLFGGASTAATGGFGSSVTATGTAKADFEPFIDHTATGKKENFRHLCFMNAYKEFSPEELRLQDYEAGRKKADAAPAAGGFGQSTGGFGQQASSGFGMGNTGNTTGGAFGNTNTGGFGASAGGAGGFGSSAGAGGGFGATGGAFGQAAKPATAGGFGAFGSGAGTGPFGQPSNTGATGGGLFGSAATPAKPATTGFGSTSNTLGNRFGGGATSGFGASAAGTGFGQTTGGFGASNTNNTAGGFGASGGAFGSQQQANTGFGQTQNTGFGSASKPAFGSFGQTPQQQQQPAAGGGLFGGGATAGGFGQQNQQQSTGFGQTNTGGFGSGGSGLFGQTQQPAASGGLFGQNNAQQQQQQPAAASGGLFGAKPAAPAGGGLFGQSTTATGGGGLFGSAPAATGSTGLFGQSSAQQPAAGTSTGGGLFGSSTAATGGGLFGAKPAAPATGGGLFGAPAATSGAATGGGLFGSSTTGTSGGGLFGQTQAQQPAASGGLFGSSTAATGGGLFGAKPAAPATGGGLFGAPAATTGSTGFGLGFGQQASGITPAQPQQTTSLFGGFGQAQQATPLPGQQQQAQLIAQIDKQPYGFNSLFDPARLTNRSLSRTGALSGGVGSTSSHLTATPLRAADLAAASTAAEKEHKKRGLNLHVSSLANSRLRSRGFATAGGPSTVGRRSLLSMVTASPTISAASPTSMSAISRPAREVTSGLFGRDGFLSSEAQVPHSNFKRLVVASKPKTDAAASASAKSSPETNAAASLSSALSPPRERSTTFAGLLASSTSKGANTASSSAYPWATGKTSTSAEAVHDAQSAAAQRARASTARSPAGRESKARTRSLIATADDDALSEADEHHDELGNASKPDMEYGTYWMVPSLNKLRSMSTSQLRAVKDFTVGRTGYGQVTFNKPVDLTSVGSLASIAGSVVLFDDRVCTVYPDESNKPPRGQGLNVPATISLHNCWPVDRATGEPVVSMDDERVIKHIRRLRKIDETKFMTFSEGTWSFRVEHFSRYGIEDEDVYTDDDELDDDGVGDSSKANMPAAPGAFASQQNQQGFGKATAAAVSATGALSHLGGSRAVAQQQQPTFLSATSNSSSSAATANPFNRAAFALGNASRGQALIAKGVQADSLDGDDSGSGDGNDMESTSDDETATVSTTSLGENDDREDTDSMSAAASSSESPFDAEVTTASSHGGHKGGPAMVQRPPRQLLLGTRHAETLRRGPVMRASLFATSSASKRSHEAADFQDDCPQIPAAMSRSFGRYQSQSAAVPFVLPRGRAADRMGQNSRQPSAMVTCSDDSADEHTTFSASSSFSEGHAVAALDLPPPGKYLRANEMRIARGVLASSQPYNSSLAHGRSGIGADAGLMMARSFRVAFGPQGQIVYLKNVATPTLDGSEDQGDSAPGSVGDRGHGSVTTTTTYVVIDNLARHIHAAPGAMTTLAQQQQQQQQSHEKHKQPDHQGDLLMDDSAVNEDEAAERVLNLQRLLHLSMVKAQWKYASIQSISATDSLGSSHNVCPSVSFRADTSIADVLTAVVSNVDSVGDDDSTAAQILPAEERRVLELASVLFDALQQEVDESTLTRDQLQRIRSIRRRQGLTKWLMDAVYDSVQRDLLRATESASPAAAAVFALLTGHRVEAACLAATSHRDYRLATLIAQCGAGAVGGGGGNDKQVQSLIRCQLDRTAALGPSGDVSRKYRQVYELLSGNVQWETTRREAKGDAVFVASGIDWKRAFALGLWYAQSPADPLEQAVKMYEDVFAEGSSAPVAPPLPRWVFGCSAHSALALMSYKQLADTARLSPLDSSNSNSDASPNLATSLYARGAWDPAFQLLKLFSQPAYPLESALAAESFTPARADVRLSALLAWLLCTVRGARGFDDAQVQSDESAGSLRTLTSAAYDRLLVGWAFQLETLGLWHWACFLLMQLTTAGEASREYAIRSLLERSLHSAKPTSATNPEIGRELLASLSLSSNSNSSDSALLLADQMVDFVVTQLHVPRQWVYEAYATRSRYECEWVLAHASQCQQRSLVAAKDSPVVLGYSGSAEAVLRHVAWLLSAGRYSAAHTLTVQRIAPDAIMRGDYRLLKHILDCLNPANPASQHAPSPIAPNRWASGGHIYSLFLSAVEGLPAVLQKIASSEDADGYSEGAEDQTSQIRQIFQDMISLLAALPSLAAQFDTLAARKDSIGFYDGTAAYWYARDESSELSVKYSVAASSMASIITGFIQEIQKCVPALAVAAFPTNADGSSAIGDVLDDDQQMAAYGRGSPSSLLASAALPLAQDMRITRVYQMARSCFDSLVGGEVGI
ncbi:hypothetical protein GGI07_001512 [Coemansia sp. Benny D115]|nr:hypothetical protein GGI07_001512 [Coemansia sp. Benny D115]